MTWHSCKDSFDHIAVLAIVHSLAAGARRLNWLPPRSDALAA